MNLRKLIKRLLNRKVYYGKNKIGHLDDNVTLPFNILVPGGGKNISIGNNTVVGTGATFMATNAK